MPYIPATELHAGDLISLPLGDGGEAEVRIDVIHTRDTDGVVASGYAPHMLVERHPVTGVVYRIETWSGR